MPIKELFNFEFVVKMVQVMWLILLLASLLSALEVTPLFNASTIVDYVQIMPFYAVAGDDGFFAIGLRGVIYFDYEGNVIWKNDKDVSPSLFGFHAYYNGGKLVIPNLTVVNGSVQGTELVVYDSNGNTIGVKSNDPLLSMGVIDPSGNYLVYNDYTTSKWTAIVIYDLSEGTVVRNVTIPYSPVVPVAWDEVILIEPLVPSNYFITMYPNGTYEVQYVDFDISYPADTCGDLVAVSSNSTVSKILVYKGSSLLLEINDFGYLNFDDSCNYLLVANNQERKISIYDMKGNLLFEDRFADIPLSATWRGNHIVVFTDEGDTTVYEVNQPQTLQVPVALAAVLLALLRRVKQ